MSGSCVFRSYSPILEDSDEPAHKIARISNEASVETSNVQRNSRQDMVDKLSAKDLKTTLKAIEDIVSCSFCQDSIFNVKYLKHCKSYHLICGICNDDSPNQCPRCQKPYFKKVPSILATIIDVFPTFCVYNCESAAMPNDNHYEYCEWRFIDCLIDNCNEKVRVKDLTNHIKDVHPGRIKNACDYKGIEIPNSNILVKYSNLICVQGHMVWNVIKYCPFAEEMSIVFKTIPKGKTEDNIYIAVYFMTSKLARCAYSFILDMNTDDDTKSEYEILLTESILERRFSEEGSMKFNFVFNVMDKNMKFVQNTNTSEVVDGKSINQQAIEKEYD